MTCTYESCINCGKLIAKGLQCSCLQTTYQPERSKREDSIPEWGSEAPLNYHAWQAKLKERDAVL